MKKTISSIMNQYPRLSDNEIVDLCKLIKKGDLAARDKLALSNVGLILEVCKQMHVPASEIEDMFEECFVEYLERISRYDPSKGKFSTFIYSWLRERIKKNNECGMPVRSITNYNKIKTVEDFYVQEYDRLPTEDEIAEETGLSLKVIRSLELKKNFYYKDSLNRPLSQDEGSVTLGDLQEDFINAGPEELVIRQDLCEKLHEYLHELTPRQQIVIDCLVNLSGKYEGPLSLREIEKLTGIGRMTASNEKDAALSHLKWLFENGNEYQALAA